MALQAQHPHRRVEEEDQPLRGGRRLWQQGDQDQRAPPQDGLEDGDKEGEREKTPSLVVNVAP